MERCSVTDHELQRDRSPMRRTAIAATWVFGATVPLVAALVFLFGCCVLPFHAYIHKAMPLCHLAMAPLQARIRAASGSGVAR